MTFEEKDELGARIARAVEQKAIRDMETAMLLGRAPHASEITIDIAPDGSKAYTVEWDRANAQEAGTP